MADEVGGVEGLDRDEVIEALQKDAHAAYARREEEIGSEAMRELERRVVLSVLDRKWREHLYEMDYLREGIGLRGYAQRDPLVEYQREGFDMFMAIMDGIKEESVGFLFNLEVQLIDDDEQEQGFVEEEEEPLRRELRLGGPARPPATTTGRRSAPRVSTSPRRRSTLSYSAPVGGRHGARRCPPRSAGDAEPEHPAGRTVTNADDEYAEVGRNALCPCGSGKKYKRCHGAPGGPTGLTARING